MRTLSSMLETTAQKFLDHPAIIEHGHVFSYRWLVGAVHAVTALLGETGVGLGTRVALVLPNGAAFVSSFFAVTHMGGIVLPLNPSLQEPEIASVLGDAKVSLVLTVPELRDRCVGALRSSVGLGEDSVILLKEPRHPSEALEERIPAKPWPPERAVPHGPAVYLYSSGSTGRPKRIERSHFNLLYETDRLVAALRLSPSDRVLGAVAFSHTNGLMRSMIASVLSGATLIPVRHFERRSVGRIIQEHAVTVFVGVPFMFAMLAETRWPRPVDFSSLRLCISSSAPLPPEISRRFYERYGIHVRQLYGTTETGTISVNLSLSLEDSLHSVGTPLEGIDVEIFSEDRHMLAPGEVGEIGISSPAAAKEYPGLLRESKAAFCNGYFFTGDIGRRDDTGRIYLIGRKSLFINRGGYKVNPYEVEELIQKHPKVREAVVVGVDTEYGDQKIRAVIVPSEPCEEREIIEFCRGKIADFKVPSIVEFRTQLPKASTGKILRRVLQTSAPS